MSIGWKLGAVVALALSVLLLIALFIIGGQRNEARTQRDSAIARASALAADLSSCQGNVASLASSIKDQGASIERSEAKAKAERDLGNARYAAAEAANKKLREDVAYYKSLLDGQDAPKTCEEGLNAIRANRR